jgi:hypothetical protein
MIRDNGPETCRNKKPEKAAIVSVSLRPTPLSRT